MSKKCSLTFLCQYLNKFETNIENYVVPALYMQKYEEITDVEEEQEEEEANDFVPFQTCPAVEEPRKCLWLYMDEDELKTYTKLTSKRKMRKVIDRKIGIKPKGAGRLILIEFMLSVTLFCKKMEFTMEQTSALLSMHYLTHKHFTDRLYICAEDIYSHFKQFIMFHSFLFPPTNVKIFDIDECKKILVFFCSLYLRHLPLIRLLTLPNFGFELNYELEPEPKKIKEGKKGGKKDKKKKKDGKGSKKSKKSK